MAIARLARMAEEDINQSAEQIVEPKPAEGIERRKNPRRVLRTTATVILNGTQTFQVRTIDISIGGMAIVAPANPKPGVTFTIRMTIPLGSKGTEAFEAKAKVMHSVYANAESGFKIGLSFIKLSESSAATVEKYLA